MYSYPTWFHIEPDKRRGGCAGQLSRTGAGCTWGSHPVIQELIRAQQFISSLTYNYIYLKKK